VNMDVNAEDLLPELQRMLGSLMVENAALRAAIAKLQSEQDRDTPEVTS
jgi:hypothetical protein